MLTGDVHRHVRCRSIELLQQEASFQAAAAAVLDQETLWAEKRAHLLRVSPHNREFRPRQVVFLELRDSIKQTRALLVVKIFARDGLGDRAETVEDIGPELFNRRGEVMNLEVLGTEGGCHRFCASRIPL